MSNYDDVEKGLVEMVTEFLTANSMSVDNLSTENNEFDSDSKPEWYACRYIPNDPEAVTSGTGGLDRITGIFQLDFNVPVKTGLKRLRELERLARAYFWAGRSKTYGSAVVRLRKAGFSAGRTVGSFFRRPLTITFYSDLTRSGA